MRMVKNEIFIQRGETFSLDFAVRNAKGDPLAIFSGWENPYLVITVSPNLYEQNDDTREVYWLDLNSRWVEQSDGSITLEPMKKFIGTEAVFTGSTAFDVDLILGKYGVNNGGKMTRIPTDDFYVGNYLFFIEDKYGKRTYKYFAGYTTDKMGFEVENWEDYDFRVIKSFVTKDWINANYLYDIKIVAGETLEKHVAALIGETLPADGWSDRELREHIESITDEDTRIEMMKLYEFGIPLMPDYDTKAVILEPTNIYVGTDIQGGTR